MPLHNADLYRSLRRSDLRTSILGFLGRFGEMHVTMIAELCRVDSKVIVWAVDGHPPQYSETLALAKLGLVSWRQRPGGWALRLTAAGQELADDLP